MTLNEEQLRAVAHPIGKPACLIAGAGSGKTATITERVRWLMTMGVEPHRICCITFTNKAAGEIFHRLEINPAGDAAFHPHVSTIHSLALNAIRKDPEGFGFEGRVTPMDDYDQSQMVKKLIERSKPAPGEEHNPYRFLEKLGYHRARGVGFSADYTDEVHEEALEHHAGYHALEDWETKIWYSFEEEKKKCRMVDFDDMIHLVVRRGESEEVWRTAVQRRFHHVLQDESQDTSPVQWRFVNLLLGDDNPNLYCVGDMNQSIYSFQGAEPRLLKEFSEGWRGIVPDLYRIGRNHRSLPSIIRLSNRIQATMTECHPPGTLVSLVKKGRHSLGWYMPKGGGLIGKRSLGMAPAEFENKDISQLTGNELIQPWNRKTLQTVGNGKHFRVSSQLYSGPMLHMTSM